jgi:hypothetical protein
LPILLLAPLAAQAQSAPPRATTEQREPLDDQLQELIRSKRELQQTLLTMQQSLQQQLADFDARIATLEAELAATSGDRPPQPSRVTKGAPASPALPTKGDRANSQRSDREVTGSVAALPMSRGEGDAGGNGGRATSPPPRAGADAGYGGPGDAPPAGGQADSGMMNPPGEYEKWGPFDPDKGVIFARGPLGELSFGVRGYVRYINQGALNDEYTDSFGRTFAIDRRQDFQINRMQLNFRGWLFDERFRYTWYAWTQNVSMGDPAQVVVAGNFNYKFSDALNAQYGIFSLPSTRTTAQTFPNWLRIDHRAMADEYFRGSYTTGIRLHGQLTDRLDYNVALANNLSQLGISATQLDFGLNTVSGALYWMPTTGEFGPQAGFGDYEYHTTPATLVGVHFTRSLEDKQGQPGVNAFENVQIRLSDGTIIFGDDPFLTGGTVNQARYRMLDLAAGMKWRGFSLEGEYYFRWVDDFDVTGTIPVTSLFDHGFQLYTSTMLQPDFLQAYISGSKIFGQYGAPWDVALGLNYFPHGRRTVRVNFQALYMHRSAVGYTAVPYQVGGKGWVFTFDVGTWF